MPTPNPTTTNPTRGPVEIPDPRQPLISMSKPPKPSRSVPPPRLAPDEAIDGSVEIADARAVPPAPASESTALDVPADYGAIVSAAQQVILSQRTPPSEVRTRQGKGRSFRYVDHAYVTKTLNLAFGWAWDFELIETELISWDGKPFEVRCIGRLTVHANGATIIKTQCGSQAIEMLRDGSAPVTIGDAYKGAASDALKKCASLLGIALDLYDSDAPVSRRDQLLSRIAALLDDANEDRLIAVGKFIQAQR